MNPKIKHRIEQIRRDEVPEGYKKVNFSIIPNSWSIHTISEHLKESCIAGSKGNDAKKITVKLWNKGVVEKKEIHSGSENTQYYTRKQGQFIYSKLDFLNCAFGIVPKELDGYESTLDLPTFDIKGINEKYLLLQVIQKRFYEHWGLMAANGGRKARRISPDDFLSFPIVFPPLPEQQKIADILTAQDKVIELKEQLLAQKQQQKKYLMQQLLTGRKRLPGFSGEWIFQKAKEIFQSISDKNHNGDLIVLSSTQNKGIVPRDEVDIDIKYDISSLKNYKKIKQGNFVISLRSFQGGIEYSMYTGLISPAYTVLSSKKKISDEYYKQFFKSTDYINRLNVAVYGIRDGKQISYEDFGCLEIPYPSLEEQTAIADVLSTADREIDLLRQSIESEKQKKKALMQLLLTGIVRVTGD